MKRTHRLHNKATDKETIWPHENPCLLAVLTLGSHNERQYHNIFVNQRGSEPKLCKNMAMLQFIYAIMPYRQHEPFCDLIIQKLFANHRLHFTCQRRKTQVFVMRCALYFTLVLHWRISSDLWAVLNPDNTQVNRCSRTRLK